jgi:8-oxo-dGTP diphosphatase
VRCYQTIEPLSVAIDRRITTDDRLGEGYDREGALSIINEVADGSVLCSHGDVIPDVMAALQRRGARLIGAPDWRKGSTWVLERVGVEITAASAIPPPEI